jgi:hypothetical protein
VSLVLNGLDGLGTDLARHARSTAAQLAAEHGAPHLLAAALGELVVPQMHDEPEGPVLGLFLPPGLEPSLLSLPITSEPTFATTDLLALLGTNETARFSSAADVEPLKAFERVLGHGHLGHPELDGQVVVGVGRLGSKWMPLLPSHWADPTFHAAVVVGATLQPELAIPEGWKADQPFPGVVRAIRKGVGASCLDGGLDALFDLLRTHHAEGSWGATPSTVDVPRSRDLGRLAMFHLAAARGELDVPLTPTDGGTARTLAEIAEEPRARWVLRGGIAINEPWTFAVTRDELAVLDPTGQVGLRFDDSPASYQADDTNWLVRRQLRAGGLRGWIGLRLPFDPTASVLIQTPRGLEGIDDLDSRVPCHGILHPDTQTDHIDLGVATQVLLVGLEVYQALAHQLRGGSLDDARRGEAEHYARRYVRLAESDGSPNRTVVALAAHLGMVLSAKRAISPAGLGGLAERLDRALGGGGAGVATVRAESLPRKHLVVPAKSESTDDHVVLLVNADHPLGARALAGDQRAREAVALELARQACQHLRVDLLAVQVSLLASRLG